MREICDFHRGRPERFREIARPSSHRAEWPVRSGRTSPGRSVVDLDNQEQVLSQPVPSAADLRLSPNGKFLAVVLPDAVHTFEVLSVQGGHVPATVIPVDGDIVREPMASAEPFDVAVPQE